MLLRYEDFTARPLEAFQRILSFVGEPDGDGPFVDRDTVVLRSNHAVAGNPDRFTHGRTSIRADERWRTGLLSTERTLVTVTTLPLMLRYGYGP